MKHSKEKELIVASPRGFCAGVVRAIETVENTIDAYGGQVYVLHEIVHNRHVIAELEEKGAVFVEKLEDIPTGEICIFSAHGVSVDIEKRAEELGLKTIDATCPLVSSIHRIVEMYHRKSYDIIILGHHNHPEVEGTAGRVDNDVYIIANEHEAENLRLRKPQKCAYVTQTTLSQDDIDKMYAILLKRFPKIESSTTNTCYATQNRQDAVKRLAAVSEVILVVGSRNSSNSNRLKEVAIRSGVEAYLVDDSSDIRREWLEGKYAIGITAGASAPERLVEDVVDWIGKRWSVSYNELQGTEKKMYFKPAKLADA
ncbi:MAG TPA: 4-hydroxy-3-methylbut-2-enyl diphosphate reductase [Desulfopila sp.]|nr:4-hydroxy-3-methylbut-2-enyl diphosphate reductase [Desulfopila sp.]